jgi:hypothetical protein
MNNNQEIDQYLQHTLLPTRLDKFHAFCCFRKTCQRLLSGGLGLGLLNWIGRAGGGVWFGERVGVSQRWRWKSR